MAPPSIRTGFDAASSLEQLQTLVATIDHTAKVPSVHQAKPFDSASSSISPTTSQDSTYTAEHNSTSSVHETSEQPTTSTYSNPTTSTNSDVTTSANSTAVTSTNGTAAATTSNPATASTNDPSTASTDDVAAASNSAPATVLANDPVTSSTNYPAKAAANDPATASTNSTAVTSTNGPATTAANDPATASIKSTAVTSVKRSKRVRVQAFQQILEVSPAMKLQRTMAAATIAGRAIGTQHAVDTVGTAAHDPLLDSSLHSLNTKSKQSTGKAGCNPMERKPSLPQPTVVLEASHKLIMDVIKDELLKDEVLKDETVKGDASVSDSKQDGKQDSKQDAVCQWVYRISVSNPKIVEILSSRDVLCFSKEMLSQDLPSCTEMQSITQFDWTDLEMLPWE